VPTHGGTPRMIFSQRTIEQRALAISPDGKLAAFCGPVAPVEPGDDPAEAHNEAYQDLWIVDLVAGAARNVSLDFAPSVNTRAYGTGNGCDFVWKDDGKLYFSAFDRGKMLLCTFDPRDGKITGRNLGTPGFGRLTIPTGRGATMLAYRGDHLARIGDIQWYDLKEKRGGPLIPLNRDLHRVTTPPARVVRYDFVNSDSITVPGYLYYPAGYDSTRSYPLIVDTYGGVIGFGEGWLWGNAFFSDRGYFDYIPVPRGAAGYGLAFADAHCGDWGRLAARDMNEGVRHVIAHVAGVDSTRIGFDSGSYGGFLAMYLMSMDKDDPDYFPYATAVGGYGISDLADYWGIGAWGSWYMELSAPGKQPWDTPQWFIDHSPVFHAENITNPLLLVHGDADINVPVGNSDEMYTALKLLGRNVTFVRWPGEGHGVARDRVHYLERKRIELEWFDKWLRGRDGAWKARMKGELEK
jgi:dipeptidyl aminopeptidase/acylaminoacyl peptidase